MPGSCKLVPKISTRAAILLTFGDDPPSLMTRKPVVVLLKGHRAESCVLQLSATLLKIGQGSTTGRGCPFAGGFAAHLPEGDQVGDP